MQCVEFEDRLNRLLDHRVSPDHDGALVDHARDCESCAGLMRAHHRLFIGLRQGQPAPPPEFAQRVVAQLPRQNRRRSSFWQNASWGVLLASAASLGGLALIALGTQSKQQDNVAKSPSAPLGPEVRLPSAGVANVGPRRMPETRGEKQLGTYFVALENFATQISDSKEFDEVSESLQPSIKPIRSSFGLAIDALRRTLPRGKEPRSTRPDAGASWLPEGLILS